MATCDYPSDLVHRIAYPTPQRSGPRIDLRVAALPAQKHKQLRAPVNEQGIEEDRLFREIESGAKFRRNPWAGAGALTLQSLLLVSVLVIPLLHMDPLPQRQRLTMLYLQPPPAAVGNPTKFQAPKIASTYTPTSTGITAPVHKTQEALPPSAGATGGALEGVPGGAVGGASSGVPGEILNSTPSVRLCGK